MALSHRAKVAKKKLLREVMGQFGARRPIDRRQFALIQQGKSAWDIDAQIAAQANPRIQQMFYPGRGKKYPINQATHDFSKMPRETVHNFVPIGELLSTLHSVPEVTSILRQNPFLQGRMLGLIRRATRERGIKASKFWEIADKGYIDRIAKAAKGNPNVMNDIVGDRVAAHIGTTVRPIKITDIGSFAGGTIKGAIRGLSMQQKKITKIVLVDVAGDIVKGYAVPELVAMGIPRQNIKVIPASFYNAAVAFGQMPKPLHEKGERAFRKEFLAEIEGSDVVVAGAATINFATHLRPYLRSAKTMLKRGGIFINWDWGSREVSEPAVNVARLKEDIVGKTREGRPITHYDAYVSFLEFWMRSYGYPPNVMDKLIADINASPKFNFMGWLEAHQEWVEHERQTSRWTDKDGKEHVGRPGLPVPFGFRNRAYRLGDAMHEEATKLGLEASGPEYPVAKPGELNTGNLNWMMVMRKK